MKPNVRWFPEFSLNGLIRIGLGLLLVAGFVVDAAEWKEFRPLMQLELWAYDARVRLFMPRTRDARLVIVDIDERSLNAEGHWPWGRDKLALLIRQLFDKYQVRVTGFDVAFAEADSSSGLPVLETIARGELKDNAEYQAFLQRVRASLNYDQLFADAIRKRLVVLGFLLGANEEKSGVLPQPAFEAKALDNAKYNYFSDSRYSGNIAMLQASAMAAGHLNPALDQDGVTRSVPLFMRVGDGFFQSMSLAVLRNHLGNVPINLETTTVDSGGLAQGWIQFVRVGDKVRIPLDYRMAALVPYRGHDGYRYVSATDVLYRTLGADELRDKIILVGTSARGLVDLRATPGREDLPGVEVHANLVSEYIVKQAPSFVYREVDKVRVKGKLEGITIFEPVGRTGDVGDHALEEIGRLHQAIEHYRMQRWDEAETLLTTLADASPETELFKVYLERIAHFRTNPPGANWDGVFVFSAK